MALPIIFFAFYLKADRLNKDVWYVELATGVVQLTTAQAILGWHAVDRGPSFVLQEARLHRSVAHCSASRAQAVPHLCGGNLAGAHVRQLPRVGGWLLTRIIGW